MKLGASWGGHRESFASFRVACLNGGSDHRPNAVQILKRETKDKIASARPWIAALARASYAAIGFVGYSLWCLIQAVMDTEDKGRSVAGIIIRLFYAAVGVVYAALAWSATRLVSATGGVTPGDKPEQQATARSFTFAPLGRWLVAIVGAGFIFFCFF